ncbi:MAG: hypothetical protein EB027_07850 [Actinobacteria bacterium]|nr:hypothetical protein [Actinomycetota bacterium]
MLRPEDQDRVAVQLNRKEGIAAAGCWTLPRVSSSTMTLPDERLRALHAAREFLLALLTPSETPKVPRDIRRWASRVLKHYPGEYDIDRLSSHPLLRKERTT